MIKPTYRRIKKSKLTSKMKKELESNQMNNNNNNNNTKITFFI